MPKESRDFITAHIQEWLEQGALEETQTPPHCISPIATVPKKNGKLRMILNLKRLNQCVVEPRFRCENLDTLQDIRFLQPGDWCSSLDLQNGFFHVPVHPESRLYLGFPWNGSYYQYDVLPFGLSASPWAFTTTMRKVMRHIRSKMGARVTSYVDDLVAHRGVSPGVRLANRASDSAVSPPPTSDQQGEVFPPSGPERGLFGAAIGHVITPCAGPSTIRQTTHDSQDNEPPAVRFSGETSPCTCRCTSCRTNNCSNEGCCASKTHATGIIPRFGEGS